MNSLDQLRLIRIDREILQCEHDINQAKERELRSGSKFFKLSKALETKYARLLRTRSNFERLISRRVDRRKTFALMLKEKRQAELVAEEEVKVQERNIAMITANYAIHQDRELLRVQLEDANAILRILKISLRARSKAVIKHLEKSESMMDSIIKSRPKQIVTISANTESAALNEIRQAILNRKRVEIEENPEPIEELTSTKLDDIYKAGFDMLMQGPPTTQTKEIENETSDNDNT